MELVQTGSGSSGRGVGGGGFRCICISPRENPVFWVLCLFASPWVVYAYIAGSVWDNRLSRSWINSGERHHPISLDLVQGALCQVFDRRVQALCLYRCGLVWLIRGSSSSLTRKRNS